MKPIRVMQKPAIDHWTYEDYLRLPDDGTRCEIIEGERLMMPAPWSRHQDVSIHRASALLGFVEKHDLGKVFAAPFDVVLANDTVVQPDIVVIARKHRARLKDPGLFGPPDLAVEILSPGTRDRDLDLKMCVYAHHGVREYWIVDPIEARIAVYVLEAKKLVKKAEHTSGEVRSLVVLPGFSAKLTGIFRA